MPFLDSNGLKKYTTKLLNSLGGITSQEDFDALPDTKKK